MRSTRRLSVGLLGMAWRRHGRSDLLALRSWSRPRSPLSRGGGRCCSPCSIPAIGGHPSAAGAAAASTVSLAEHMPGRFLVYLWELFLPRLSFMGALFPPGWPFRAIYVVRGWGAFGWYVWSFPNWVYETIIAAMSAVGLLALATVVRERAQRSRARLSSS